MLFCLFGEVSAKRDAEVVMCDDDSDCDPEQEFWKELINVARVTVCLNNQAPEYLSNLFRVRENLIKLT